MSRRPGCEWNVSRANGRERSHAGTAYWPGLHGEYAEFAEGKAWRDGETAMSGRMLL